MGISHNSLKDQQRLFNMEVWNAVMKAYRVGWTLESIGDLNSVIGKWRKDGGITWTPPA